MGNFISSQIRENNRFYKVVKVFFEIDSEKIDMGKSNLFVDDYCFKLNLKSVNDVCCPIGYEVWERRDRLEIKLIINDWEGAFDTDFEPGKDTAFQDEKYLKAVLQNEIIIDDYYSLKTKDRQKSIITYWENITGNKELRRIKFGIFGLFDWISRKKYVIKTSRYAPWI